MFAQCCYWKQLRGWPEWQCSSLTLSKRTIVNSKPLGLAGDRSCDILPFMTSGGVFKLPNTSGVPYCKPLTCGAGCFAHQDYVLTPAHPAQCISHSVACWSWSFIQLSAFVGPHKTYCTKGKVDPEQIGTLAWRCWRVRETTSKEARWPEDVEG